MKIWMLCTLVLTLTCAAGEAPRLVLSDFQDPKDRERWDRGDAGAVELSLAPRATTDANVAMKVVFKNGEYPGFSLKDVPKDWSSYEAVAWTVWSDAPYNLQIRIDDAQSTDYKSRFNKVIQLDKGNTLCQIRIEEIARVINAKDIKRFILFAHEPPSGLTLWFDDVALGPLQSEQVPFLPYAERLDLQPTLKVETPHIAFARNLAGGPLKAFVMSGVAGGREVPELMQRLDLNISLQTWDRSWDLNTWGMGDFYGQRGHAFDRVLMQKYFASSMQGPEKFNVLLLPTPVGWREFPAGARAALLKRVRDDGEGLVLVQPFPGEEKWPADLLELSALIHADSDYLDANTGYMRYPKSGVVRGKAWKAQGDHPITRGVPLEAIPFERLSHQKYELAPGAQALVVSEDDEPLLAVKLLGKGRVVTCAWIGTPLLPAVAVGQDEGQVRPYRYWETLYSLMARAMCWAAGREFKREGQPKQIEKPEAVDSNLAALQWLNKDGKVTDWELKYTAPGTDGVKHIKIEAPAHVLRGQRIRISVAPFQEISKSNPRHKLSFTSVLGERCQGKWRTLVEGVVSADMTHTDFETAAVRQPLAVIRSELRVDGKLVAKGEAEVVVTPPGDPYDDFEVFMWPVDGLPYLREYEDVLMADLGSTGVMDTAWENAGRRMRWSRAGLRILPHNLDTGPLHIRPYEFAALAKKYLETKDRKFLIRPDSFADPEFLKKAKTKARESATQLAPFHIPAYVLCDEPSLTSYQEAFDFDFHPENIKWFRRELEKQFKTVENLSAAWGMLFKSFEKIDPPTTEEAKISGTWSLWNAWRSHNDTVMAEGYRMYRDAIREVDPQARISLSGTQIANPYDGFDWAKLSPLFDAMSGYGYGEQERARLSFYVGPGQMKNATPAGYGNSGKGVSYQLWSQLANHGCGHVLFWWVSLRNPDLTFCQSARDYQKGIAELRSGIGRQYQLGTRHTSPVAVQYSMNSMRAAWVTGRFELYAALTQQIVHALVEVGLDPVFISDEQIAAGELQKRGHKAVFLPLGLSLGQGAKPGGLDVDGALAKFVAAGGISVATHDPEFDEFLQKAAPGAELLKKIQKFDAVKDKLSETLAEVGVHPWVGVKRPDGTRVPGLSVVVHKLSGEAPAYLVTLLRKPVGQKEVVGADGVLTYQPAPGSGHEVENCRVSLAALGSFTVHALRCGERLEPKDGHIELKLPSGDAYALTLLPYRVKCILLNAKVEDRALKLSWSLEREGAAGPFAPHAMRIDVTDKEGRPAPAFSQNATCTKEGKGALVLPLALEDTGREWSIMVKDVLSGTQATATVKVP